MSYGHVLKTVGRQDDGIAAYRKALACQAGSRRGLVEPRQPQDGRVLGRAMSRRWKQALATRARSHEDRLHLHFALGKAYGDRGEAERVVPALCRGQRRCAARNWPTIPTRRSRPGRPDDRDAYARNSSPARAGLGDPSPDPIFILGLPRAGSTLVEQILAEPFGRSKGRWNCPTFPRWRCARRARTAAMRATGPGASRRWTRERLAALGAEFLERTRVQRKTGKPFYIDKLPNNWAYTGFIHLILPNAKIIDARRHPLDCCFSNFRQHFAKGQGFTYDLDHIGRYYADYVRAMDHYDRVLPGPRPPRDPRATCSTIPKREVRALARLSRPAVRGRRASPSTATSRAVRTASSEQVRRPINRDGVGQWRPLRRMARSADGSAG